MKIHNLLNLATLMAFVVLSCSNKKSGDSSAKENSAASVSGEPLPFLSTQEVSMLYSIAEQVDILFYKLPISVSQDEAASAKNTVLYVTPAAPRITALCEPIGRLSWISGGKIVREADFYIGEGCNHFVFFENGKPAYKNAMGIEGVQYFQTIMSQVPPSNR